MSSQHYEAYGKWLILQPGTTVAYGLHCFRLEDLQELPINFHGPRPCRCRASISKLNQIPGYRVQAVYKILTLTVSPFMVPYVTSHFDVQRLLVGCFASSTRLIDLEALRAGNPGRNIERLIRHSGKDLEHVMEALRCKTAILRTDTQEILRRSRR